MTQKQSDRILLIVPALVVVYMIVAVLCATGLIKPLASPLFVGCGEKKEPSKVITFTHASNKEVPIDLPLWVTSTDTIYFNPIINHSRIPNNK